MSATAFRGYVSKQAWARAKWRGFWRFVRWFPRNLRNVIRLWWWRSIGKAERLEREAAEAKANAEFRFQQMKEARHAVHMLKVEHRGASVDLLRIVADEIDCGGNAHDCHHCGFMDPSTGVTECSMSDRGECAFEKACELRDLAAALETYAASGMSAGTAETQSGSGPQDCQPGPSGDAKPSHPTPSEEQTNG